MAWRVAVCDDEVQVCSLICEYLERLEQECGERFEISLFHSAEALLADVREDTDLLLLDIRMGGMSGMHAARELRRRGSRAVLIFITTMTQFAIEGYEVHAYGFLRKPLQYARFRWQLSEALSLLRRMRGSAVELRSAGAIHRVETNGVLYFEAFGHSIDAVLAEGPPLSCSTPLEELASQLENAGFFRCHKSYLVNLKHVCRIDSGAVRMANGADVPLSKYRRKEFLLAFARYREGTL